MNRLCFLRYGVIPTRSGHRFTTTKKLVVAMILAVGSLQSSLAETWPQWRGAQSNNHAGENTRIPSRWNLETGENILWKTAIPGRGHSTPAIADDYLFLTTADADAETQSLIKVDRVNGRLVDQWVVHRGTIPARIHPNNSHASPSPAIVDESVLVSFYTDDAIVLSKLTFDGRVDWQKRVSSYQPTSYQFGYGASPIIEGDTVIVAAEYDGDESGVYALDLRSGNSIWKIDRPSNLNFASPIVATIAGQRQLILAGAETITAYDPQSGKTLWTADAGTEAHCGTVVWDGRNVIASGGNPEHKTWCVSGDGRANVLWENTTLAYEQSLLVIPNYVFCVADSGAAHCWRTSDGTEMWAKRLFGRGVSASPLLVGNRIVAASERGDVAVFSASPNKFEMIAQQKTGDSIFASPVAVDDRLFLRTGVGQGDDRQEFLVAIGE